MNRLVTRKAQDTLLGLIMLALAQGVYWINAAAEGGPGHEIKLVVGLILVGVGIGLIVMRYYSGVDGEKS